jgi:hypothetical protein
LLREGEFFVACRGGKAGMGNVHFASGSNRSPQKCTSGQEGEVSFCVACHFSTDFMCAYFSFSLSAKVVPV